MPNPCWGAIAHVESLRIRFRCQQVPPRHFLPDPAPSGRSGIGRSPVCMESLEKDSSTPHFRDCRELRSSPKLSSGLCRISYRNAITALISYPAYFSRLVLSALGRPLREGRKAVCAVLSDEMAIQETLADDAFDGFQEPALIVVFALVEAESLLVEVTVQEAVPGDHARTMNTEYSDRQFRVS